MAVSKKLRFEVFRRDNFACRYCGRTAAAGAYLEPDHVVPRSRGGHDVATNLATACENCNSGKSDTPLQAPAVPDVPQELFRRACADRGADAPAEAASACEHEQAISMLLSEYRERVGDEQFQEAVGNSAGNLEGLGRRVSEAMVAGDVILTAYEELDLRIFHLHSVLHRILVAHAPDILPRISNESPHDLGVLAAAETFAKRCDEELLKRTPHAQVTEWFAYVQEAYGFVWGGHEPLDPESRLKFTAEAIRAAARGTLPRQDWMCSTRGEHIPACPRAAAFKVWAEGCAGCVDGGAHEQGHGLCSEHTELFKGQGFAASDGRLLTARRVEPFHTPDESACAPSANEN